MRESLTCCLDDPTAISNHIQKVKKKTTFFFVEYCGFDPFFTSLTEVSQLVLETVYDNKNDWNLERSIYTTKTQPKCKPSLL